MDIKIFTKNIEPKAENQIYELAKLAAFSDAKIRIMPDVHYGASCSIGFTADLGDKVIPNVVGVDIGCGMLTVPLGKLEIDFEKLDKFINRQIPSGFNVRARPSQYSVNFPMDDFKMGLEKKERLLQSIGTLGGGNHFIEVAENKLGERFLIIHTGSRNLGKQVADWYQNLAVDYHNNNELVTQHNKRQVLITKLNQAGRNKELQTELAKLKRDKIPKHLCYLEGELREEYLHDMKLAQLFATMNRYTIAIDIMSFIDASDCEPFETVHNYIGEDNIIRKGAIAAYKGQKILIPINMRDGSLLCVGKGNEDWNYSAPHGAGRLMSRSEAKRTLDMKEFKDSMEGIYTTSVQESTLDESPQAYKPMEEIINAIGDTAELLHILKPIYNFKDKGKSKKRRK